MDIFISRNGQNQGPYTLDELRDRIDDKRIDPKEFAWHEGLDDWIPAQELLDKESGPEPVPAKAPESAPDKADPEPKPVESASSGEGATIWDTPPPRSRKLRSPGSVPEPEPAPAPTGASIAPASSATPASSKKESPEIKGSSTTTEDGTVVSSAKLTQQSSLPTPEPIAREHGVPSMQKGIDSAPPNVHVRKKPRKEYQLSMFRLLALPAVAVMLFVSFMPWVRVQEADGEIAAKVNLGEIVLAKNDSALPFGFEQPKSFPEFGRLLIVCALVGACLISMMSIRFAARPPDVISFGGLVLCFVTIALVAGIGYLYGSLIEKKLGEEVLKGAQFSMDMGFYFGLAVGVFGIAMVLLPTQSTLAKLGQLMLPVIVVLCGCGYLVYRGMQFHREGGPGFEEVIDNAKGFYEELTS